MLANKSSIHVSYLVPCICFVVITFYAFSYTKTPLMKREKLFI